MRLRGVLLTDWQITLAAIVAAILAKLAFAAARPSLEMPPRWARRTRWTINGLIFLLFALLSHQIGPRMYAAISKALTIARDTGRNTQDQANEMENYLNRS